MPSVVRIHSCPLPYNQGILRNHRFEETAARYGFGTISVDKFKNTVVYQTRPAPKEDLIVLDGKEPRHGSGASILSAVTVSSQHYLGSALVDQNTNEIPVTRELFNRLELEERLVSLDALHTQDETARALVLEHGADYLLTVKGNQPTVRKQIENLVAAPQGDFSPS